MAGGMNTTMPISLTEWIAAAGELQTEVTQLQQRVARLERALVEERARRVKMLVAITDEGALTYATKELEREGVLR